MCVKVFQTDHYSIRKTSTDCKHAGRHLKRALKFILRVKRAFNARRREEEEVWDIFIVERFRFMSCDRWSIQYCGVHPLLCMYIRCVVSCAPGAIDAPHEGSEDE